MDYIAQLELIWEYFPYIFYAFVLLTFLPKSVRKIRDFAAADYAANRHKFHRCYGPDLCCHALIEHDDHREGTTKPKPRKAVTRSYLRKQQQQQLQRGDSITAETHAPPPSHGIRRQVQASAIQTQTNVNQIAKMFESGAAKSHKKINRVLPEIRMSMHRSLDNNDSDASSCTTLDEQSLKKSSAQLAQLLQENIENSMNLLHQQTAAAEMRNGDWHNNDNGLSTTAVLQRRACAVPSTLTFAGTSATPSTASPAASSPHSSPASSSPTQPASPIMRNAPLNLKTSVEDIFAAIARSAERNDENFIYAGCNTLAPVTSIDDILSQRRLSRTLSAYSISELLNEESPSSGVAISIGGGVVENLLLSSL